MPEFSNIFDYNLDISHACSQMSKFGTIHNMMETALKLRLTPEFEALVSNPNIFKRFVEWLLLRNNEQYTEYQIQESVFGRSNSNDRIFPLETVELQRFRGKHGSDIEDVIIHTGPYANEYARSFNALAVTIANEIFFRNNAFDTGSEEGKKTLTHELTHVAQYDEGRINASGNTGILEEEAEAAELREGFIEDPDFIFQVGNKLCKIKRSEMSSFVSAAADMLEGHIRAQKDLLDDKSYAALLIEYETWLKKGT
jgi:hypothetical protein